MEPDKRTTTTNLIVGASTPLLFTTGLAFAGWISIWAIYAWASSDAAWLLTFGSLTVLALALPVAFVGWYERWQVKHRLYHTDPHRRPIALNWACGLFAGLLGLLAFPLILLFGYFAWGFWSDGAVGASIYFAIVASAVLVEPVAFLVYYDRWQTRNSLQ